MPRKNPDFIDQQIGMRSRERHLRVTFPCYSDTKTFLIVGAITIDLNIPPYIVSMTPALKYPYVYNDRGPTEIKFLKGYCGQLGTGTCTIRPMKNGAYIGPTLSGSPPAANPLTVTTTKPTHWSPVTDEALDDRDVLAFDIITASTDAKDLAASFVFEIRPGTVPGGPGSNQKRMIFTFLNGTSQQQEWFREAIETSWNLWYSSILTPARTLDNVTGRVDVEFVADPGGPCTHVGWSSAMEPIGRKHHLMLRSDLDSLGKQEFCNWVIHGFIHMAIEEYTKDLLSGQGTEAGKIATWTTNIVEKGTLAAGQLWDTGPWDHQVREALCEIITERYIKPELRGTNKTALQVKPGTNVIPSPGYGVAMPNTWEIICDLFIKGGTLFIPTIPLDLAYIGQEPQTWITGDPGVYEAHFDIPYPGAFFRTTSVRTLPLPRPTWGPAVRGCTELNVWDANNALIAWNRTPMGFPTASGDGTTVTFPQVSTAFGTVALTDPPVVPLGPFGTDRLPLRGRARFYLQNNWTATIPAVYPVIDADYNLANASGAIMVPPPPFIPLVTKLLMMVD